MKKQQQVQKQVTVSRPTKMIGGGKTYKLMKEHSTPRSEAERWRMRFELGLLAMGSNDYNAALSYFEPLWEEGPTGKRRDELVRWLGMARSSVGNNRDAFKLLEEAFKKAPWDKDVAVQYATSLENINRMEDAEQVARHLYALDKKDLRHITLLSEVLVRLRRYDEASKLLFDSKKFADDSLRLAMSFGIVSMKSKQELEAVEWILREIEGPEINEMQRMGANFALGDLYDKIGNYEEAFKHYALGNQVRESTFKLKTIQYKRDVAKRIWTPERIRRLREHGHPDLRPVFIIGMPRSGTTLTEQVLGRHEKVFPAGELRIARTIPEKIHHMFNSDVSTYTIASAFDSLNPAQVKAAAEIYINHIARRAGPSYTRVIDKMPGNIWHIGMLASLMPNAKFIFSRRDPRDVCLSCYFRNFRQEHGYSTDLKICGEYCREVFKMADYWDETFKEVTDEPVWMASTYENLVSDPQKYGKELFDHVGLEWDSSLVEIEKEQRNVATLRTDQVGRAIDTKSKERWKRYEEHVGPIEEGLGDVMPYIP